MSELDNFLSDVIPRQIKAEKAIHNGDPVQRLEMWSENDPVTLFGAWGPCKSGTKGVWKIVHRHGDLKPVDESEAAGASTI
jgi:hypothetical protein